MKIEHEYNGKKTGAWVEMVCDSIWEHCRISTMAVRIPRIVLAELNTHRAFARNSASSRAIPAKTMRERVLSDPYIPWRWPVNGKGMSPKAYRDNWPWVKFLWLTALFFASLLHRALSRVGVHKEVVNRLLEPWMWTEVLITATEWQNFLLQRAHPAAQDPIRAAAECVQGLLDQHVPTERRFHIPYVQDTGSGRVVVQMLASARRCRRVSYLKQGVEVSMLEDAREGLSGLKEDPPHLSPYEHIAAASDGRRHANFDGWMSLRWSFERGVIKVEELEKALGDRVRQDRESGNGGRQ